MTTVEWISVDDRLPEYDQSVLVYDGQIAIGWLDRKHGWLFDIDTEGLAGEPGPVTHWALLPEPPEDT